MVFPSEISVELGKTQSIACNESTHSVSWTFNGGVPLQNSVNQKTTSGRYSFIKISKALRQNRGTYRCYYERNDVVYEDEGVLVVKAVG